jgi:hypothetical protein
VPNPAPAIRQNRKAGKNGLGGKKRLGFSK